MMVQESRQMLNVARRGMNSKRRFFLAFISGMMLAGCQKPGANDTLKQLQQCQEQQQILQRQLQEAQVRNAELERDMANLRQISGERMDHLIRAERIELGRFTGGFDDDKDGRDDRLKVYLVLRDRAGDVVKAAGEVDLEIWDLAQAQQSCLYRRHFTLAETASCWLGGFLADHYKFEIPFGGDFTPTHNDLTIKLTFTDALTGQTHLVQQLVTIRNPITHN